MAKKKRVDPIKQREKRAKVAAVVGILVLALVAAYEIPTVMKATKTPPAPVPASSASTAGSSPAGSSAAGSLPNIAGGASASAPASSASSGQLVDTDLPPPSTDGQLVSFNVFATKNPFTPQVSTGQAGSATTTTPSATNKQGSVTPANPTSPTTTPATTTPVVPGSTVVPPAPATAPATTTTTTTAPQPAVAISVNGVVSHVASEGTFPAGAPVFRLASWTHDSAQVAIVGGSYASGGTTLTLHIGQALTLENQTDGKRYKLELLSTP
jgi:hypothetical protein